MCLTTTLRRDKRETENTSTVQAEHYYGSSRAHSNVGPNKVPRMVNNNTINRGLLCIMKCNNFNLAIKFVIVNTPLMYFHHARIRSWTLADERACVSPLRYDETKEKPRILLPVSDTHLTLPT